jgi:outer membrane murein-binding lipoprotein Lpp
MIPEWLLQLGGMVIGGAGIYAGIRADLAAMHAKIEAASSSATRAHQRIDEFILQRH